jgi:hypothetical protein
MSRPAAGSKLHSSTGASDHQLGCGALLSVTIGLKGRPVREGEPLRIENANIGPARTFFPRCSARMNCQSWHRNFSAGLAASLLHSLGQVDVADRLGVSRSQFVKILRGRFGASSAVAQRIRDFLIEGAKTVGISVGEIGRGGAGCARRCVGFGRRRSQPAIGADRLVQAAGAALMTPTSLGLLLAVFPPERRGSAGPGPPSAAWPRLSDRSSAACL